MRRRLPLVIVWSLLLLAPAQAREGPPGEERRTSLDRVLDDSASFYSRSRLIRLGVGLAMGGALANSDTDQSLYDDYAEWSASSDLGDLAAAAKLPGEAEIVVPLFLAPALILGLEESPGQAPLGRWWRRTARAYLVGAPPLYYLQQITGGSRPGEVGGSGWQPFEGNHGVSGHAFFGAVPFLTLARSTDRGWLKVVGVGLSLLPAWSRLEDEEHFPSQVALGWLLAWEATGAIDGAEADRDWTVSPLAAPGVTGLALRWSIE